MRQKTRLKIHVEIAHGDKAIDFVVAGVRKAAHQISNRKAGLPFHGFCNLKSRFERHFGIVRIEVVLKKSQVPQGGWTQIRRAPDPVEKAVLPGDALARRATPPSSSVALKSFRGGLNELLELILRFALHPPASVLPEHEKVRCVYDPGFASS